MPVQQKQNIKGFTLLELLVIVAITLIVAGIGYPEFNKWIKLRTPAGRWGKLDELIGACIFLASPASNFVNGQIIFVDGGLTISL